MLRAIRGFFGGRELGYTVADLADPDVIVQLGVEPVRIDIIGAIEGVPDFGAAWERWVNAPFGSVPAHYISLADLIVAKRASSRVPGRERDASDLRALLAAASAKRPKRRRQR